MQTREQTGASEAAAPGTPPWVEEVLAFWFGELDAEAWFKRNDAVDQVIRERFLALHESVAREASVEAAIEAAIDAGARAALATVIVLDQLPRNMFRGSTRAFGTDAMALATARAAVDRGLDAGLGTRERQFLYLPFEHSERLEDQDRSLKLYQRLGDPEALRFAEAHRDIIVRFGRFPHRNATLGRHSTPEELAFLATPGSSF